MTAADISKTLCPDGVVIPGAVGGEAAAPDDERLLFCESTISVLFTDPDVYAASVLGGDANCN